MRASQVVRALGPIDAANVRRDPLLRWILALPLVFAVPIRLVLPPALERMSALLGQDLLPLYVPLVGVVLLLTPPVLVGMVVGFLLLDQRDDRTLLALRVTPLAPAAYVAYRLSVPVLLSVLLTLVMLPLAGVTEPGPGGVLLAAMAAAPLGPLMALALAVFAENKVQGFALTKGLGMLMVVPAIGFFVQGPWHVAFALAPTYWPARLYWDLLAGSPLAWLDLLVGLAYQGVLLRALLPRL